jgi:hypothetical protein
MLSRYAIEVEARYLASKLLLFATNCAKLNSERNSKTTVLFLEGRSFRRTCR